MQRGTCSRGRRHGRHQRSATASVTVFSCVRDGRSLRGLVVLERALSAAEHDNASTRRVASLDLPVRLKNRLCRGCFDHRASHAGLGLCANSAGWQSPREPHAEHRAMSLDALSRCSRHMPAFRILAGSNKFAQRRGTKRAVGRTNVSNSFYLLHACKFEIPEISSIAANGAQECHGKLVSTHYMDGTQFPQFRTQRQCFRNDLAPECLFSEDFPKLPALQISDKHARKP